MDTHYLAAKMYGTSLRIVKGEAAVKCGLRICGSYTTGNMGLKLWCCPHHRLHFNQLYDPQLCKSA